MIKNDDTVVMRVEVDPTVGGRDAPEIHWRGVAFDHYEHGRWSRSENAPDTREQITDRGARPSRERHVIMPTDALRPPSDEDIDASRPRRCARTSGSSRSTPTCCSARACRARSSTRRRCARASRGRCATTSSASSTAARSTTRCGRSCAPPSADALRAATGHAAAEATQVYLQLPPGDHAAHARARRAQITAGATNDYDKAVAIQTWLTRTSRYTLELDEPDAQEPVDFFLFDRKKGHCEYFASAFAVLARAVGIPTRQVNGFLGGEWNEYEGYVAVRAGDAHSWDEVYFPGARLGHVRPDAGRRRPARPRRHRLARADVALPRHAALPVDEVGHRVRPRRRSSALFKDVGGAFKRGAIAVKEAVGSAWRVAKDHAGTSGAGAGLVVAVIAFVAVRRRRGGPRAMDGGKVKRRARGAIAQAWDAAVRALAKAGVARDAAITPREYAARATIASAELRELVELYYTAEWGGRADAAAERRAGELADAIAAAALAASRTRASRGATSQ